MSKVWEPYALHILDAIAKIRLIEARGDLIADEILYDAALRNLQTLSEATQRLPESLKNRHPEIPWRERSVAFATYSCMTTWARSTPWWSSR